MRPFIFCSLFLLAAMPLRAQYTYSGHIEFERKANLHKLWDGDDWMERMKDQVKPFFVTYSDLYFTQDASRYAPGREVEAPKMAWGLPPGADNVVHQDYRTGTLTESKTFFDEKFMVRDSLQKRVWRIGTEVRTIAGYKCRKAITRVCDSVVVVAFYTDEIPVSGGPEGMGGLPGMILELAVPRLYTTWIATKVDVVTPKAESIAPPPVGKAKLLTVPQLEARLQDGLKDWGKNARRTIWWAML